MSEEEFCHYLAEVLNLPGPVVAETALTEDLGLDSFAVYELMLAVEELGVHIDDTYWGKVRTIRDCHVAYDRARRVAKA